MWPFSSEERSSERNGTLQVRRQWGAVQVIAHGYQQTGEGLNTIWRDAFTRAGGLPTSPRVLLLGLGAGGVIQELHAAFPGCRVVAIEHDAAMITLAKELGFYERSNAPEIIYGDALEVVPKLREQYDLIVVDLFCGNDPSPILRDEEFLLQLREQLAPQGVILVNICQQVDILDGLEKFFPVSERWTSRYNILGSFRLSL